MGMTWEQFWEQDSSLVKDYREAYRLRQEEANYTAWLNGLYIYEALCLASPLFRAFSKSGTRAGEYPQKPHEFAVPKHMTEQERNEQKMRAGMAYMEKMTAQFNKSFFQKQKAKELDAQKQQAKEEKKKTGNGGNATGQVNPVTSDQSTDRKGETKDG